MQIDVNQNPEQIARDNIDKLLRNAGWAIQSAKKSIGTNHLELL